MKSIYIQFLQLFLAFVFATTGSLTTVQAIDYRSGAKRAEFQGFLVENRVMRKAISIGRASGAISHEEALKLYGIIEENKPFPANLANDMQKLIRIAQLAIYLQDNKHFFTHGYEFETIYPNHDAKWTFKADAEKFKQLLRETVGVQGSRIYEQVAKFRDGRNRTWDLKTETVRHNNYNDGYELISPPITAADDIEQVASLIWRLGEQEFGKSNQMTGGHQTFSLVPVGQKADSEIVARVYANMMLMQAQFAPVLYNILDVRRMGGYENFFFRPTVFDHREMLQEIQHLSENGELNAEKLNSLLYVKYIQQEFALQTKEQLQKQLITQDEFKEMQSWSIEQKAGYRMAWKYRDLRPKINVANPEKSLLEVRIGDYVDDRPEQAILETFLYQKMLGAAWNMAQRGETFQLSVPERKSGETDEKYWQRLSAMQAGSIEQLFQAIGIVDENLQNLIQQETFKVTNFGMRANDNISFAFEAEGSSESIVNLILPRDPDLRAKWDKMSVAARVVAMKKMGYDLNKEFNWNAYNIFVTEFYANTDKFPFLSPDLHLEASGNWEIKSSARGLNSIEELRAAIVKINAALPGEYYGLHIHEFLPGDRTSKLKDANAQYFTDYMERLSFYMLSHGYAEAPLSEPSHYYDSWSLDRYSIKDLQSVLNHLTGKNVITSNLAQKYHNVAFRPVKGGLDIEFRDLGDEYDYGIGLAQEMEQAIRTGNFGNVGFEQDEPLFFGFGENAQAIEKDYRLETVMAKEFSLSDEQIELLRKFQFEVYKPSMREYMYFENHSAYGETENANLDTAYIRSNFENNLILPLLNYDQQSFLSAADKKLIRERRVVFLERVRQLMLEIEKDPKYAFLKGHQNFLHLCDWLERSTHATRPNFGLVSQSEAKKQRVLLEDLVYRLRGLTVRFARETRVDKMYEKSLDSKVLQQLVKRPDQKSPARKCKGLFKKKAS